MRATFYFLFFSSFLALLIACSNHLKTPQKISVKFLAGTYIIDYSTADPSETGWDYNQKNRIERLEINMDSTYSWELKYPLGGFQVLPENGKLRLTQNSLFLESGRSFVLIDGELFTTNNVDREELNEVPWIKQD